MRSARCGPTAALRAAVDRGGPLSVRSVDSAARTSNLGTRWLACQDSPAWPRVVLHRCAALYGQNQATFVWAAYGGTVLALDLGVSTGPIGKVETQAT